jgi:ABC-type transport system substrate-binding protein
MFKSQQSSSFWEFQRNPDYYLKDDQGRQLPFLDGVRYNVVPEVAQQVAQFLGGNVDEINITPDYIDQVKSQVKNVNALDAPGGAKFILLPQLRQGPLQDPRIRQAISMALDRDGILAAVSKGQGGWNNYSGYMEGSWYLDPRKSDAGPGSAYVQHNLNQAKQLVEQAGFKDQLKYSYPNNVYGDLFNQMNTTAIAYLKQAGFDVQPITLDYKSQYIAPGGKGAFFGSYDGLLAGYQPVYPHAYLQYHNVLQTKGPHNSEGYSDPTLDQMITGLQEEFDTNAAYTKAHDIQKYTLEKLPVVPIVSYAGYQVWQPSIHNFSFPPAYGDEEIKFAWKSA